MSDITKVSDASLQAKLNAFIVEVSRFFNPEAVEAAAIASGFVERESKLTGHLFLTVFTFGLSIYGVPSLNDLTGLLKLVTADLEITRQGLHDRIQDEAVKFFEIMLGQAIQLKLPKGLHLQTLQVFKRILIFDSTSFQAPDAVADYFRGSGGCANKAAVKILFGFDLKSNQFFYVVQEGVTKDSLKTSGMIDEIMTGDLNIHDLGFFNIAAFIEIDAKGAYFLSRLLSNASLYRRNAVGKLELFDLPKYLQKMTEPQAELEVYLKKDSRVLKTRLIVEKAPDSVKNQRLRQINKTNQKKGHQTSDRSKIMAGFSLYITNAPAETLRPEHIRPLYGARWQIELVFKSWKSNFNLAKVDGVKVQRIKCLIYARLLFIFISGHIINAVRIETWLQTKREVSAFQAAKHLKIAGFDWLKAIVQNKPEAIQAALKNATDFIAKRCLKGKSKKRTYPLQLLDILEQGALA